MPRRPYLRGKSPQFPLDKSLGGPQSRSGRCGEKKILDKGGNLIKNNLVAHLCTHLRNKKNVRILDVLKRLSEEQMELREGSQSSPGGRLERNIRTHEYIRNTCRNLV
jgi:hypothetical protein